MSMSRGNKFALISSGVLLFLVCTLWLVANVVKFGRGGSSGLPTGPSSAIPDSQLRELLRNPATQLDAIVKVGQEKTAAAVPELKRLASGSSDFGVRAAAVKALGQIAAPDSAQALVTAAGDGHLDVRIKAIEALGKVRDPSCLAELVRQTAREEPEARQAAAVALASYREADAIAALAGRFHDAETVQSVRLAAAKALAGRTEPDARAALAKAATDKFESVRLAAVEILAASPQEGDWAALCRAMLDPATAVRTPAFAAVRKAGPKTIAEIERALIATPSTVEPRRQVVQLLMEFNKIEAVPAMLRALDRLADGRTKTDAPDHQALRKMVTTFVKQQGTDALPAVVAAGVDARCGLFAKEAAAEICIHFGAPAVKPINDRILKWNLFPSASELMLWVKTLGTMGDPSSAAALNRALAQDVPEIEELVAVARTEIEKRSGQKLPPAKPDYGVVGDEKLFVVDRKLPHVPPVKVEPGKLPADACVYLILEDALIPPQNVKARKPLKLELIRRGGKWEPSVAGTGRSYNQSGHEGAIIEDGETKLKVEICVNDDPWVSGGFGVYQLELKIEGQQISGQYRGQYNYREVSGSITSEVWAIPPVLTPDIPPLESGEHPRMFFRKQEIPAMRVRAKREPCRTIVRAIRDRVEGRVQTVDENPGMDGAVGCGFLYALYGDEAMGRRAVPALLAAARKPPQGGAHAAHDMCYEMNSAAFAYDLVYDVLTDEERAKITEYLAQTQGIIVPTVGLTGGFNNPMASNWTAIGLGGAGPAALATLREKGRIGINPPIEVKPVFEVAPQGKTKATPGVPVVEMKTGEVLTNWLVLGPFDDPGNDDPLKALGGLEKARLTPETAVEFLGQSLKCVPLPESAVQKVAAFGQKSHKINLPAAKAKSRSYLACLLKVADDEGAVVDATFPFGFASAAMVLDGVKYPNGTTLLLRPGLYHLVVEVNGKVVCPMFIKTDAQRQMGLYQRYLRWKKDYEKVKQRYDQTGERQDVVKRLDIAKRKMVTWWRVSIGDHGWGQESGYWFAHGELMPFTVAYETATGERVIPGSGIPWMAPLTMAMTTASGMPYFSSVKGAPLAMVIHCTDPKVQPAMLLPFQKDRLADSLAKMNCKNLAFLFVNYPLDVEPKPAGEVMPLAFCDARKGGFVFRSSYDKGDNPKIQGGNKHAARTAVHDGYGAYAPKSSLDKGIDDMLAAIFLRSDRGDGGYFYAESGTFRITGLGTHWAGGLPGSKRNWQYAQECAVVMPPANGEGLANAIYSELKPDGSGVVGADMSGVNAKGHNSPPKHTRHFAVDYSGKSGAAALIAIVDRIDGGNDKTWLMHSGGKRATVNGKTFTIDGQLPDTSLFAQLLTDAQVELTTGPIVWNMTNPEAQKQKAMGTSKGIKDVEIEEEEIPDRRDLPWGSDTTVRAICKEPQVDYFFVMTIQRGQPPKFEVQGSGLNAKVKVGKAMVRFANERLIIE